MNVSRSTVSMWSSRTRIQDTDLLGKGRAFGRELRSVLEWDKEGRSEDQYLTGQEGILSDLSRHICHVFIVGLHLVVWAHVAS